jgi:putative addiction module component (TIGR02574 family)
MLADYESLRQLSVAEKLRIVDFLWEDIRNSGEELVLSDNDRAEIERRLAEIENDPSSLITEEEMWRRVDEARG